jgi:hypothetical protein
MPKHRKTSGHATDQVIAYATALNGKWHLGDQEGVFLITGDSTSSTAFLAPAVKPFQGFCGYDPRIAPTSQKPAAMESLAWRTFN